MTDPTDAQLLAFLEGTLSASEREAVLAAVERDPAVAADLRRAALGLALIEAGPAAAPTGRAPKAIPLRIALVLAASLVAVVIPATLALAPRVQAPAATAGGLRGISGVIDTRAGPEAGYLLVLHGRWPDASALTAEQAQARVTQYWRWADSLRNEDVLMAAGDLRWEPGRRLGAGGTAMAVPAAIVNSEDFLVGIFALRVDSYEAAEAIARQCPHLRFGGSVSVRKVGSGFVAGTG